MRSNYSASHNLSPAAFLAVAHVCANEHGADMLLSGPGYAGEHTSRIGLFPKQDLIISRNTQPSEIHHFCFGSPSPTIGWFSYELGMRLRNVASTKPAPAVQGHLKKYGALLEYDAHARTCIIRADSRDLLQQVQALLLQTANAGPLPLLPLPKRRETTASLDRTQYEDRVRQTLEYIRDGQAYQLNLSIQFEQKAPGLDSIALFFALFQHYPAPLYALFTSAAQRIVSTSPERFLKVANSHVLSQPIKGTRVVDENRETEARAELLASAKEHAELSMIVDLIRNDISRHCDHGSVQVYNHCAISRVENLLQMYSSVHGKLRQGSTCLDLFLSALPGGSITGCPKHRAMELIDQLEPHTRGVYCGSFVYIEDEQNMDSSICIRTGVHDRRRDTFTFHAGSGIVVDSDPAREYEETLAKAAKFLA